MPLPKGTVEEGAALSNSFTLDIPIIGTIVFISIGDLEQELKTTILADSTAQSTGKVDPTETEAKSYAHHDAEIAAIEAWFTACKSGALGAKQVGTLHARGADGQPIRSWLLDGILLKGRTIPGFDAAGEGEAVMITWKLIIDNVVPLL